MPATATLTELIQSALLSRNECYENFFAREAPRLAIACRQMSERFIKGGRLLAFGRGRYATDAQHVSVEFVHPVIVGKRALPAIDISTAYGPHLLGAGRTGDIAMGFGPPHGDEEVQKQLDELAQLDIMTFALPGARGDYFCEPASAHPFQHQEAIEMLYHVLWETVHVFLEHQQLDRDAGEAAFLYPFLGSEAQPTDDLERQVASSILMKVEDDARLRALVAQDQSEAIAAALASIRERLDRGGKLIIFGNGGSATDANDWAIDCVFPPAGPGLGSVPAISLSNEPAILTALANDVGTEVIFLRQLIAHARPEDVAIGISTSGGSRNIILALEEARKRGLLTVALLGYDGGEIARRGLADRPIVVASDYIPRIQEVQASVYHIIRELLHKVRHA